MVKLFSHRGYTQNNFLQNSVASLKNAVNHGFKAIEFDVWLVENELILSHDKPEIDDKNFKTLPRFADFLIFKNDIDYWIDFKNLDEKNILIALEKLNTDIISSQISFNKIFFAPYITSYDLAIKIWDKFYDFWGDKINIVGVCDDYKQINELERLFNNKKIKYISIFHELINDKLTQNIAPERIFAWTVNDKKILNKLVNLGILNFATDTIIPFKIEN